jgi:membrane fusion protein
LGLFRNEVYDQRRTRLHGEVLLTGTSSNWLLVLLITAIVAALVVWVTFAHYARTEAAVGDLVPDGARTDIFPTRAGVVTGLRLREGDPVKAGQPLFTVVVEQASANHSDPAGEDIRSIDRQDALIDQQISLMRQTQAEDAAKLAATISQSQLQLDAISEQIADQSRAVQSARDSFEPLTLATNEGYVSRIEYEARRQQLLNAKVQLAQLKSQQAQVAGQLRLTRVALSELPAQTNEKIKEMQADQATLIGKRIDVESAQSYVVTAPVSGRVSALQIKNGSMVDNQMPMLSIINNNARLHAELYVTSRGIGFAKVGQEVRLMYDAFPYQRFGSFKGRILAISHTVLGPDQIRAPVQLQTKDPVYLLSVSLNDQSIAAFGERVPLQPGMTLQANLILDRRSFLDWLLEPINAVRNRN